MGLTLPTSLTGPVAGLRDKAKLILATLSAVTATTMAVITFSSGGGGIDELAAADAIQWSGPVGLLDADYEHLVTIGKIESSSTQDEYTASEVRDPMVAPSGALQAEPKPKNDGEDKAPAPVKLPDMWLSGIIWDPETPIVIIDGQDLRVGDRVKGARIVEIRRNSVVLSFASKHFTLTVD